MLIDAHDRAVGEQVWWLYARALTQGGAKPSLIEWDNALPAWETLLAEAVPRRAVPHGAEGDGSWPKRLPQTAVFHADAR